MNHHGSKPGRACVLEELKISRDKCGEKQAGAGQVHTGEVLVGEAVRAVPFRGLSTRFYLGRGFLREDESRMEAEGPRGGELNLGRVRKGGQFRLGQAWLLESRPTLRCRHPTWGLTPCGLCLGEVVSTS